MSKDSNLSDFNLFLASDAMLGVMDAIYELMGEGPAEGSPEHTRWVNSLTGLAWAGRRVTREMNAFLYEASDMHRFPKDYSEIESSAKGHGVRETAAIYAVH